MTKPIKLSPSKISAAPHGVITSYGAYTTPGLLRPRNEDRISLILNINTSHPMPSQSFIGIYDGHAGNSCADYLRDSLHVFLGREGMFASPSQSKIVNAFAKAEKEFLERSVMENEEGVKIVERSGACALCVIFAGKECFVANVGDSRAVLSKKFGGEVVELTRDHKPGDKGEEERIIKNQGRIYQYSFQLLSFIRTPTNTLNKKNNEQLFGPLRVFPGRLSVCRTFGDIEAKHVKLGGNPNVVIAVPEIKVFDIDEKSDFIILGSSIQQSYFYLGDGIYDKLSSEQVVKAAWDGVKGKSFANEHEASGFAAENVIREAMRNQSLDNLSVVIICFENFKKAVQGQLDSQAVQNNAKQNEIKSNFQLRKQKLQIINTLESISNLPSNPEKIYSQSTKTQIEPVKLFSSRNAKPIIIEPVQKECKQPISNNEQNLKSDLNKLQQKMQAKKLQLDLINMEDKENLNCKNVMMQNKDTKTKQMQHIDALYAISPKLKAQTTHAYQQFNLNFNRDVIQDYEIRSAKHNSRQIAFNDENLNINYVQTKELINTKLKNSLNHKDTQLNFKKKISENHQPEQKFFKKYPTQEMSKKLELCIEGKNTYIKDKKPLESTVKTNNVSIQ